jgi:hypothetical protein
MLSDHLYTRDLPDPDLIIRTGGEMRLSNYLIWQAAYAEYYSSPRLWPDFDHDDFIAALDAFAARKRRFGKTDAQIAQETQQPATPPQSASQQAQQQAQQQATEQAAQLAGGAGVGAPVSATRAKTAVEGVH